MSSDETRNPKPAKSSTPPPDQSNAHVYPDWAAMQAYYGPRGCMPAPYFNPAMAPGHPSPPPYMWGPPQPMMSPYGPPYAVYAHGGVYPHPGMPLASGPPIVEAPTKSSGNTEQGQMKKLKGFDGLAMSIGTGNAESAEDGSKSANSQSTETEGSSNGTYDNTTEEDQKGRKKKRENKPATGGDKKRAKNSSLAVVVVNEAVGKATHANTTTPTEMALELKNPPPAVLKTSLSHTPQPWSQNDKELKREKRKQSNRDSARRSRLRKQAETEELAKKVEVLLADNSNLLYELNRLSETSEKLKLENATLMENLKKAQEGRPEHRAPARVGGKRAPITTENLLSRVDNAGPVGMGDEGGEMYETSSKSGGKLRQLLHPNPRADTVVAS